MPHHDLLIIGAGSGNSVIGPEHDDWDIAIAEPWLFGGTCMNRGCIPSKMLVHAADLAITARHAPALGVHTTFEWADWPAIRDRIFGRIDPIAVAGLEYRHGLDNVTVYGAEARFTGDRSFEIGAHPDTADRVVLAAGAWSVVPDLPGLADTPFHTSAGHRPSRLSFHQRLIAAANGCSGWRTANVQCDESGATCTSSSAPPTWSARSFAPLPPCSRRMSPTTNVEYTNATW